MKLRSIALASGRFGVRARRLARHACLVLAPAARTGPTLIPTASAACPDAEVVFARGRQESPGAGVAR